MKTGRDQSIAVTVSIGQYDGQAPMKGQWINLEVFDAAADRTGYSRAELAPCEARWLAGELLRLADEVAHTASTARE